MIAFDVLERPDGTFMMLVPNRDGAAVCYGMTRDDAISIRDRLNNIIPRYCSDPAAKNLPEFMTVDGHHSDVAVAFCPWCGGKIR